MRVLVLGATGSIGTAVSAELHAHGHRIIALARSDTAAALVASLGYEVLRGDIRHPADWAGAVADVGAVIHLASTFGDDMGEIDRRILRLLHDKATAPLRLIYTGGCWLYGATGDRIATEDSAFDPIAAFDWAPENAVYALSAPRYQTAILHPAMVYHRAGGVFGDFVREARDTGRITLWGTKNVRWPLVHRDDLARAYRLMLEHPDLTGHFNASTETGIRIRTIAGAIFDQLGAKPRISHSPIAPIMERYGDWAFGCTLDQQMAAPRLRAAGWHPRHTDFRASPLV